MLQKFKKRQGFTLIELIVVMAIIAILVLLAAPKYLNYTKDAHVTAMQQDSKVLSNIALGYNVKYDGVYPIGTAFAAEPELTGEVTLADINKAITGAGVEDDLAITDLAPFDATKVAGNLQGLKNNLTDYAIVTNGAHEGEVVYLAKVLENSDGLKYVSVNAMPTEVVQP